MLGRMRIAAAAAAGMAALAAGIGPAAAADPVRWTVASAYPTELEPYGALGLELSRTVERISGGALRLTLEEPGARGSVLDVFDRVKSGAVDAAWSSPAHWQSNEPSLALFGAVPFGPSAGEYLAWMYHGGGAALMDEVYARHGLKSQICGMGPPEASGWFRTEIRSLDDFKGLRMRFYGLGAKVMEKLGVSVRQMGGAEILSALEAGTLDATEYSIPTIDLGLGFGKAAKHYYFPGWHQQTMLLELVTTIERWASLDDLQRAWIETACKANIAEGLAADEAAQARAIAELTARGVDIRRWPVEILDGIEAAWLEVAREEAAADASFAKAWESLQKFRAEYDAWGALGYL